jgi:hypothetical protein
LPRQRSLSAVGFLVLYLLVGREPSVPSHATLTLAIGGDPAERSPDNVVSYLPERAVADDDGLSTRSAKPKPIRGLGRSCLRSPGHVAVLGQGQEM